MPSAPPLAPPASPAAVRRPLLDALQRLPARWDLAAALLLTLAAAALHLFFYRQGFPLWRDEVNAVQMATLSAFADTWKFLPYDSIPLGFHLLVRAWVAVLPPDFDSHLRLLGLLIGLGILGAFWLCVRTLGGRAPLLSLTLLGFNPLFIRYGDSVRAFGLGILLALLTFAAVWRVLLAPRPGRVLWAALAGVLSVNALFYNAVLLLAVCGAAAAVAATEKRWRTAALLLAVGLPAALSLLPYADMIREQHRWGFLLAYPVTLSWIWTRLSEVAGSPDPLGVWAWTLLFLGIAALAVRRLLAARPSGVTDDPRARAVAFTLGTLLAGTAGYVLFLRVLNYRTQPWYYVTLLALAAVCLDVLVARLLETAGAAAPRWRLARLGFALGFPALVFFPAWQDLLTRPTNLDLLAARIARGAAPEDLVVHTRWECAISFGHYYHGSAPQETLPPLADHRFHRYDLVLAQMMTPDAAVPVLDRMARTLQAGHRVWLVGSPVFQPPGQFPPRPAPMVHDARGWRAGGSYYSDWNAQASFLLQQHAARAEVVEVPARQPVSAYEHLPLSVWAGWR